MVKGTSIYFASDFHLGAPDHESSRNREDKIIRWLDEIEDDAKEIFLVGDIFDFWFEYKHAIPKGFIRIQGKIANLVDKGIAVHFFIGNHDMWMFDYFPKEIGVQLHRKPIIREWNGKRFLIGHGDGLGPGDKGYKFIKKIFASRVCQWLFARLHPNFGIGIANYWSRTSRKATGHHDAEFLGEDKEWLIQYCRDELVKEHYDYFIFGHRHLPIEFDLQSNSKYINLGDWLQYYTYLKYDGEQCQLLTYEESQ